MNQNNIGMHLCMYVFPPRYSRASWWRWSRPSPCRETVGRRGTGHTHKHITRTTTHTTTTHIHTHTHARARARIQNEQRRNDRLKVPCAPKQFSSSFSHSTCTNDFGAVTHNERRFQFRLFNHLFRIVPGFMGKSRLNC